jgi:hypothetical protein
MQLSVPNLTNESLHILSSHRPHKKRTCTALLSTCSQKCRKQSLIREKGVPVLPTSKERPDEYGTTAYPVCSKHTFLAGVAEGQHRGRQEEVPMDEFIAFPGFVFTLYPQMERTIYPLPPPHLPRRCLSATHL